MRVVHAAALTAAALLLTSVASAQGLGDAAAREKEKRKAAPAKPAKVYTEGDIGQSMAPVSPTQELPAQPSRAPPRASRRRRAAAARARPPPKAGAAEADPREDRRGREARGREAQAKAGLAQASRPGRARKRPSTRTSSTSCSSSSTTRAAALQPRAAPRRSPSRTRTSRSSPRPRGSIARARGRRAAATAIAEAGGSRCDPLDPGEQPPVLVQRYAPRLLARVDRPGAALGPEPTVRASRARVRRHRRSAAAAGPGRALRPHLDRRAEASGGPAPSGRTTTSAGQARPVDPALEVGAEVAPARRLERRAQVLGARLRVAVPLEKRARPGEERLVARRGRAACAAPRRPCRRRPRGRRAASCFEVARGADRGGSGPRRRDEAPSGPCGPSSSGRRARRAARAATAPPRTAPRPRTASARGSWRGPCPGPTTGAPPRAPGRSRAGR